MRRRLAAGAAVLGAALLVPWSTTSADTAFPATGRYVTFLASACEGELCTGADIHISDSVDGFGLCVEMRHASEGIVFETEIGCLQGSKHGKLTTSNRLIVGIGPTTVEMESDLTGQTRNVTLSVATAIATNIATGTDGGTIEHFPDIGCTTTWSGKFTAADTSGTATISGDAFTVLGIAETWQTKTKKRCNPNATAPVPTLEPTPEIPTPEPTPEIPTPEP